MKSPVNLPPASVTSCRWVLYVLIFTTMCASAIFMIFGTSSRYHGYGIHVPVYQSFDNLTTSSSVNKSRGLDTSPPTSAGDDKISRCSQSDRVEVLKQVCSRLGKPFGRILRRDKLPIIIVDDKRKLMFCSIPKVASTAWLRTLVVSKGMDKESVEKTKVHRVDELNSFGFTLLSEYNDTEIQEKLDTYFKFLVVRHPFDRLVSAWQDKVVNKDGDLRRLVRPILNKYKRDRATFVKIQNNNFDDTPYFVEFARYLAESELHDPHVSVYNDKCDPCTIGYNHIVKLETVQRDAPEVFRKLGLDYDELPVAHSNQKKEALLEHHVKQLPQLTGIRPEDLTFLLNKYGPDLDMFGYSWSQHSLSATCAVEIDDEMCC